MKYSTHVRVVGVRIVRGLFPGLWLDRAGIFARDQAQAVTTLRSGLASPEHAAFVRKLQAREKA